jgi:hypothetical protein
MPFIANYPAIKTAGSKPFIADAPVVSPEELETQQAVEARTEAVKSRLNPMAYARGAVQGISDFAGQVSGAAGELAGRMTAPPDLKPDLPGTDASRVAGEAVLRGAADLGQLGKDVFESQVLDPYRVLRRAVAEEGFLPTVDRAVENAWQFAGPSMDRTLSMLQVFPRQAAAVIREAQARDAAQAADREALQKGDRSLLGEVVTSVADLATGGDTTIAEKLGKAVTPPKDLAQTTELASMVADPGLLQSRAVRLGTRIGEKVAPGITKKLGTPILEMGGKAATIAKAQQAKGSAARIAENNRKAWEEAVQRSDETAPPLQTPSIQLTPPSESKRAQSLFAKKAAEAAQAGPGAFQRGIGAAGRAAETGGKLVERAAGKVGELADKYEGTLSAASAVAGASSGPLGALAGSQVPEAIRKAARWSENASRAGTALRTIADADWDSSIPVWRQIAKDPNAPQWLVRGVTANVVGKLKAGQMVETGLRVGSDLGKGVVEGAATDALLTGLDTSKSGEEIGGEAGVGGLLGGAGTLPALRRMSRERKALAFAYDSMRKASESIQAGADPLVVASTPDELMHSSVILEQTFQGMLAGRQDLKVDLMDAAQFAKSSKDPNAAAYFDESTGRVAVNLEAVDAAGRQLHEIGHALMASVAASNPAIIQHFRQALGPDGMARARQDYQQALGRTIPQDDAFIVGELFSEAMANGLRGVNLNEALPVVLGRTDTQSFFRDADVRKVLKDPATLDLVRQQFQAASDFRPALDMEKEPGVKLRPEQAGNHPALPTETRADGSQGNDFVDVVNGQTRETPVPVVRARVRNRRKEVLTLFPDVPPSGNANPQASNIGVRQGPSGMTEKTGTRLGEQFYATARSFGEGTKNMLRRVEQAIANNETMAGWYQQIGTGDGWAASVRESLGAMEAQYKDFIPFAFKVDKQGNLLVQNYSLTALERKASDWAGRKGPLSLELWNGDLNTFKADVQTYLKNHAEGRPGSDGIGEMKRNVINVFLVGGNRTFEALNPLRPQAKGKDRQGIVRSYRADRLQTVEPSDVTGYQKPDYSKQVRNLSPNVPEADFGNTQDRLAQQIFGRNYSELFPGQKSDVDTRVKAWEQQNPTGQSNTQTKSPEFKKWFGNWENPDAFSSRNKEGPVSMVVGRDGAPLRVYHSTRGDFTKFETGRKTANNYGIFGNVETERHGVFFTDSPQQADSYSKTEGEFDQGSRTVPVYLDIKSPIDFTNSGLDYESLAQELGVSYNYLRNALPWELFDGPDGKQFVEAAKKAGYDGAIFTEDTLEAGIPGGRTFAVFDPTQIKSATGNTGAFDPNNPDIRFSPQVVPPEQLELNFNKAVDQLGTEEALAPEKPSPAPQAPSQPKDAPTTFSITASRIKRLLKRGPVNPIGMSAATAQDRHAVAALFRNPAFEAMRWVFVKEGKVVAVANTTVRQPDAVHLLTKGLDIDQLSKMAVASGADSLFWTHNHPSGISTPSEPDVRATKSILSWVGFRSSPLATLRFLGHVVTNHTDHHIITSFGSVDRVQVPAPGPDKWLNKPIWDAEIVGPSALARVGAAFANPNNPSRMILFLDPRKYIKAVGEISPNIDSKKFAEEVRKFAIANGASSAVAYGSFESDAVMFEQLVRDGILDDAFIPGFGGLRDAMMRPPRLFETPPREASEDQVVRNAGEKLLFSPGVAQSPEKGFYSKLEQVIGDEMKGASMPAAQLKAVLRNRGVKAEEMKWTKADEVIDQLAAQNGGKVPKEALMQALQKNRVPLRQEVFSSERDDTGYSQYADYTLPGGEDYREVVLAMPEKKLTELPPGYQPKLQKSGTKEGYWVSDKSGFKVGFNHSRLDGLFNTEQEAVAGALESLNRGAVFDRERGSYKSRHFDTSNYVAHMRLKDRVDADGRPGLFIEEVQSDRHQEGRQKGYAQTKEQMQSRLDELLKIPAKDRTPAQQDEITTLSSDINSKTGGQTGVPDAPFRKDWGLQMFKRALREAVANGQGWVGWTTGDTQATRFDLSKRISEIHYSGTNLKAYDLNGKTVIEQTGVSPEQLPEYIGKEAAEKLLAQPAFGTRRSLGGVDLKVGGEGMRGFYDKILPNEVQKYVKQWGGKVEKAELDVAPPDAAGRLRYEVLDPQGEVYDAFENYDQALAAAQDAGAGYKVKSSGEAKTPFWKVSITPEMAQSISTKGQERFSPQITPEQDAAYLDAVQKGDTQAAQRMVDEAAKAAGYTVGPVYHGTPTGGFNVFDKRMRGETSGVSRGAFSFTTNEKAATGYSKKLGDDSVRLDAGLRVANDAMRRFDDDVATQKYFSSKGYTSVEDGMLPEFDWGAIDDVPEFIRELRGFARELKSVNPELSKSFIEAAQVMTRTKAVPEVKRVFLRIPENAPVFQATPKTLGQAMKDFYAENEPTKSGIAEMPGGERVYYVADPEQIKSADPVTRDDAGNIIPLSQRFDQAKEDIRFSPAVTPDPKYLVRVPGATVKAEKMGMSAIADEMAEVNTAMAAAATKEEKKALRAKLKELSQSKQDLVPLVSYTMPTLAKSLPKNSLAGAKNQTELQKVFFGRLDAAVDRVRNDPTRFVDPAGYVEFMRTAGVSGNVLMPPPGAELLLNNPQQYVALVTGAYHGPKTAAGTLAAAMSGLDSTVAMRQAIQARVQGASQFVAPPPMVAAMHHLWGVLSRRLAPIHQEASWLRLVSQPEVLEHIQKSIDGTLGPDFTQDAWNAIVSRAYKATAQPGNLLGNSATSNANSFYLMLSRWNGAWDKVSDVYATPSSREMGRRFWSLNRGSVGIKNKVQRFVGLTFGIPGLIMDRWKFVEFFMGQFGKAPQDYFKYTSTGTPEDVASIYGGYGPIENADPTFSLAFYEGMETVLQAAIDRSQDIKNLLGNHPNVGGLHWVGWNAIKNEAVGHSSLDLTHDLLQHSDITPDAVLAQVRAKQYYTEGLDGSTLKRFTLKP